MPKCMLDCNVRLSSKEKFVRSWFRPRRPFLKRKDLVPTFWAVLLSLLAPVYGLVPVPSGGALLVSRSLTPTLAAEQYELDICVRANVSTLAAGIIEKVRAT